MATPFPAPLRTERLILRAPAKEDALAINEAIRETFDHLKLWMPWAIEPPTLEESHAYIERVETDWLSKQDYVLFAFDQNDGELVLATGLHPLDLDVPSFHIGYWCRSSRQGQGYVTEAAKAIRDAGFETVGAKRIEIRCDVLNMASQAVAEGCGFKLEGTFKNDCRDKDGALRSTRYYALTQDDVE